MSVQGGSDRLIKLDKTIYLDNNATTLCPDYVLKSMFNFANMGNPSSEYKQAKMCKQMIEKFKHEIAEQCNLKDDFEIIINSGASESNNHIIHSIVRSYMCNKKSIPHIITSSVEHKATTECLSDLVDQGIIEWTKIDAHYRTIEPMELIAHFRENTALVSIMAANNETGIINNLAPLHVACAARGVPLHSDAVQYFGKLSFDGQHTDAFSASFHKLHGPAGCGLLAIRKTLLEGYQMCPHICGTQNNHQRGGTENVMGIAGAFSGFRLTINHLKSKALQTAKLRYLIMTELSKKFKAQFVEDVDISSPPQLIWIMPKDLSKTIPNTILVSVVRDNVCNKAIREALELRNVIVGLGSACNTGSQSHVLEALGFPAELARGVIRISLCHFNTEKQIKKFITIFTEVLA